MNYLNDLSTTIRELFNISKNAPLWPGDTISHETANNCVTLGWVSRNKDGYFSLTVRGKTLYDLMKLDGVERFFK